MISQEDWLKMKEMERYGMMSNLFQRVKTLEAKVNELETWLHPPVEDDI